MKDFAKLLIVLFTALALSACDGIGYVLRQTSEDYLGSKEEWELANQVNQLEITLPDSKISPNSSSPNGTLDMSHEGAVSDLDSTPYKRIGDSAYFDDLRVRVEEQVRSGAKDSPNAYVNLMMLDALEHNYIADSKECWRDFCEFFNAKVKEIGYVDYNMHYFRNILNEGMGLPQNLQDLFSERSNWILISTITKDFKMGDSYHLYGDFGQYNFKFVSTDGLFEVVCTPEGNYTQEELKSLSKQLQTTMSIDIDWSKWVACNEEWQAYNMGTYNYSPAQNGYSEHEKYDVDPWKEWGNTKDTNYKEYKKWYPKVNPFEGLLLLELEKY